MILHGASENAIDCIDFLGPVGDEFVRGAAAELFK
jgi:hypothetical protein